MFNDDEHTDVYKSVAIGLEKSAYMCNSDKYSFFLNIGNLPKMQKNMIINLFKMESEAIAEIKQDDILLNKNVENKEIITQYIQDLYRFFKIHPDKKEFNDFFSQKLDIYKKSFFDSCVDSLETYRNIAELYFKKNYYDDATEVFKILVQKGENRSEIFEKIGYSYQRLLNYQMALEFYHKADFFDVNKLWITKKIAFCYLKLNNYEKALEFYQKAEKENDQDLHTQTNIGLCYLNLEDHNNALKHYFKVEYFSPSNIKVLRPIAWCSFVNGKFDSAIKYYNKLIEKESTKYDFLNLAHSYWCSGDKPNAIKNYKIALEKNDDKDEFFKDFFEDYKYLLNNNIDAFEIKLLSEYLKVYFELEK
jgi:tetratricopeptide (TPR) repeat protein